MATGTSLMTAEEYADLPDSHGYPTELLKGVRITMTPPSLFMATPAHGFLFAAIFGRPSDRPRPKQRIWCDHGT